MEYHTQSTPQLILCCQCGISITSNPANMCIDCIRNEVDITEGIPKQVTIHFCRGCERYLQPPNTWVPAQLESRELLTMCLKKLRGLSKVRLVDAGFIWTEPHSRRVRVKLTIQKEVFASTILQQVFEVEYIVSNQQCEDCARVMAQNTWRAMVQLRQKVNHKRTFLYLEQLILKHGAHRDTTNIKEKRDGLDFHYAQRSHAVKMVDFLKAVVPVTCKTSEQLISTDIHSGSSNYKFTYSVEIAAVCKDDLVCLPPRLARSLGNIHPLTLCARVGNSIHLLDPNTLHTAEISASVYWNAPFAPLATGASMTEFYVMDVEPLGPPRGKYVLADVQVARATDFGKNDATFFVRSHLGAILKPGDTVQGYELGTSNFNDDSWDALDKRSLTDVVLVRKSYPNRRKKSKHRHWKLRGLSKEEGEHAPRKQDQAKIDREYELFLRDIEEDPEMRATINLFRVDPSEMQAPAQDPDRMAEKDDEDADEEDFPEVPLEELLSGLNIDDGPDHGKEEDSQMS